jgi:hypothetical protein
LFELRDDELPFLIAHLSLLDERGENTIDRGPAQGRSQAQNVLYGSLASGIDQPYEDLQGNVGLFFLFPDVSVRWMGRYQLCVTLVNLQRCVTSLYLGVFIMVTERM